MLGALIVFWPSQPTLNKELILDASDSCASYPHAPLDELCPTWNGIEYNSGCELDLYFANALDTFFLDKGKNVTKMNEEKDNYKMTSICHQLLLVVPLKFGKQIKYEGKIFSSCMKISR